MAKPRSLRQVLADQVRLLRLKRRWTQEELGAKAKLSAQYVSLVERSDRNVTVDTIEALAKALNVTAVDLMSDDTEDNAARTKQALGVAIKALTDLRDTL